MTRNKTLAIINALLYGIMVFVNIASQSGKVTTSMISDKYFTLITPSGFTFMIWILIYGLLLIFTIKEVMSDNDSKIGVLYMISIILNIAWIILWHYEMIFISMIVILALAFVLYLIIKKLNESKENTLTKITFSVYYAWITVASVIAIFAFITSANNGVYETTLIRLLSFVAMCLMVVPLYLNKASLTYILTMVWAFVGIIVKQITTFGGKYIEIITIGIALILVSGAFIFNYFKKNKEVN